MGHSQFVDETNMTKRMQPRETRDDTYHIIIIISHNVVIGRKYDDAYS